MLRLGEKGAIPQRDKKTYAIAPHIPCGLVSPELLRKLADISEKYNAKAIKITGAARIADYRKLLFEPVRTLTQKQEDVNLFFCF